MRLDLLVPCRAEGKDYSASDILRVICENVPELLHLLPESLLSCLSGGELKLKNIRGRPPETFANGWIGQTQDQENIKEELLFIQFRLLAQDDETDPTLERVEREGVGDSLFELRIETQFHGFSDNDEIIHKVVPRAINDLDPDLLESIAKIKLSSLPQNAVFSVEKSRLGLELFSRKFLGSWFGSGPSVSQRLYIELDKDQFKLFFEYPHQKNTAHKDSLFDVEQLMIELSKALSLLGFRESLIDQFHEKARSLE